MERRTSVLIPESVLKRLWNVKLKLVRRGWKPPRGEDSYATIPYLHEVINYALDCLEEHLVMEEDLAKEEL